MKTEEALIILMHNFLQFFSQVVSPQCQETHIHHNLQAISRPSLI